MPNPPPPSLPIRARRLASGFIHHHLTELALLVLILASVGLMIGELLVAPAWAGWIAVVGDAITLVFVAELAIRFWVAPRKLRFFTRYWLDILALVPLIRPLRFFRVLRVLRLFRAGVLLNRRIGVFGGAPRGTGAELIALLVGTAVLVIAAAMVIHYAEGGRTAGLGDFPDAMWFATYSLVAGEPTGALPRSELGRWTTLVLMLGGITVFGMFIGTVSATMVGRLSTHLEVHEMELDELSDHVLLLGWNGSGPTVVRELFGPGAPSERAVVVVTELPDPPGDLPDDVPRERLYHHHGDYTLVEVLEAVGVRRAGSAILLADDRIPRSHQDRDARTVLAALTIERMVPHVYTVVELYSRQSEELLRMAGVEEIVIGDWYAGTIIGTVSRNRGLVSVLDEILTGQHGSSFHTATIPPRLDGRTVAELHHQLFMERQAVLVSVERLEDGRRVTLVNPEPGMRLRSGDRVVLLSRSALTL